MAIWAVKMQQWRRAGRIGRRWGAVAPLVLMVSLMVLAVVPATVVAHAALLSTSPEDGSVLDSAPPEMILTFNEPVRPVDGGMRLYDPAGNAVDLTGTARDDQVIVPLPASMEDGTWTFGWRVVSADGHPISGALTFSIGSPSATVAEIDVAQTTAPAERLTSIVQGLGYVGLLVAVGLMVFQQLVQRSREWVPAMRSCVVGAALAGGIAWLVMIPLSTVRQQGGELSSVFRPSTWWPYLDRSVVVSGLLVAVGLAAVLLAARLPVGNGRSSLAMTGSALAVLGPTWSGHTRVFTPTWLFMTSNIVHTLVAAIWVGGLLGLALTLYHRRRGASSDRMVAIVARFSSVAGGSLGLLIPTGLASGWIVLGGIRPFIESDYGRLVLLKIGLVAIVMCMAAWNRFRLVPLVVARNAREADGRRLLYRLAGLEAVVLVVVALVTGFLVNQSPPTTVATAAESDNAATIAIDVPLGSGSAVGTLAPAAPGVNTLTFQVLDEHGEPLVPQALPVVQASLPTADLGPLDGTVQETGDPASYQAELDLPIAGAWEISLIVRLSMFEEPIARFMVDIPGSATATEPEPGHDHAAGHQEVAGTTGTGVVYLSITNTGDEDDALLGGTTDRAERVELHEQVLNDDVASMRPIEGALPLPAGETVDLETGSLHLMLVNLTEDNRDGDVFELTLEFARAGEVTLQVPVTWSAESVADEARSSTVEVGDLELDGVWSRPAPSFASPAAMGSPGDGPAWMQTPIPHG